jgi:hypothetical protein
LHSVRIAVRAPHLHIHISFWSKECHSKRLDRGVSNPLCWGAASRRLWFSRVRVVNCPAKPIVLMISST